MNTDKLTELEICAHVVSIGDYVKVQYTSGDRFKGATLKGRITQLWSMQHGDRVKQAQLDSEWCFHEGDKIIEHIPQEVESCKNQKRNKKCESPKKS